ncbi:MAG TPA: hypothetical protein VHW72_09435 [Candidatus Angelobacter sp.]|jgi:hypothetical protein|nr:hypothetical protein [Candidatus Angelobacter sp.]
MLDEGREHDEPIASGEAEPSKQKRGKSAKAGEPQKEDGDVKAGAEPVSVGEKPAKAESPVEAPGKAAAAAATPRKTESKPLSQAERMRFRRRR